MSKTKKSFITQSMIDRYDEQAAVAFKALQEMTGCFRAMEELNEKLEDKKDPSVKELRVRWRSRGLGIAYGLPNLITGEVEEREEGGDNIAGFVSSKADGHLACYLFNGNAYLDWRVHEPNWIQVKVHASVPVLEKLHELTVANDGWLTRDIVEQATKNAER